MLGKPVEALGRHAVRAPQVAFVGQGKTHVSGPTTVLIPQTGRRSGRAGRRCLPTAFRAACGTAGRGHRHAQLNTHKFRLRHRTLISDTRYSLQFLRNPYGSPGRGGIGCRAPAANLC
ncbi:hypothetical protein CVCC1112_3239 [Paenarthrobacter nicotinovorans]|nr:hypothetical protein CVCC1112_3239 [Paenarthrobacter nicotinovorans]